MPVDPDEEPDVPAVPDIAATPLTVTVKGPGVTGRETRMLTWAEMSASTAVPRRALRETEELAGCPGPTP